MIEHTPTPWCQMTQLGHSSDGCDRHVLTANGVDRIAVVSRNGVQSEQVAAANAAFIRRAVNCHDELVWCLREAIGHMEPISDSMFQRMDAILAKATAQENTDE